MADYTTRGTASFITEIGRAQARRTDRLAVTGNKQPESVTEHSFRVGVIGSALAMMEGAAPARFRHQMYSCRSSARPGRQARLRRVSRLPR